MVTRQDVLRMFSNVDVIFSIHSNLLKQLRERLASSGLFVRRALSNDPA